MHYLGMKKTKGEKKLSLMGAMALVAALVSGASCSGEKEDAPKEPAPLPSSAAEPPKAPPPSETPVKSSAESGRDGLSEHIKALGAHDWPMRKKAAEQLAAMGAGAKDAVPDLIKALSDRDEEVRAAASAALAAVGPDSVLPLIDFIERTLGKEVFDPKLAPELSEEEWGKVLKAVLALKTLGKDSRNAADTLMRVVKSNCNNAVGTPSCLAAQGAASDTLGLIGSGAVPVLVKALNSMDPVARAETAKALGKMGKDAAEAVPVLASMLNGSQSSLCETAAVALSGIGEPAIPTLLAALHEQRPMVREPAVRALIKMGPPSKGAIPELQKLLGDPKKWTRRAAEEVLEGIQ